MLGALGCLFPTAMPSIRYCRIARSARVVGDPLSPRAPPSLDHPSKPYSTRSTTSAAARGLALRAAQHHHPLLGKELIALGIADWATAARLAAAFRLAGRSAVRGDALRCGGERVRANAAVSARCSPPTSAVRDRADAMLDVFMMAFAMVSLWRRPRCGAGTCAWISPGGRGVGACSRAMERRAGCIAAGPRRRVPAQAGHGLAYPLDAARCPECRCSNRAWLGIVPWRLFATFAPAMSTPPIHFPRRAARSPVPHGTVQSSVGRAPYQSRWWQGCRCSPDLVPLRSGRRRAARVLLAATGDMIAGLPALAGARVGGCGAIPRDERPGLSRGLRAVAVATSRCISFPLPASRQFLAAAVALLRGAWWTAGCAGRHGRLAGALGRSRISTDTLPPPWQRPGFLAYAPFEMGGERRARPLREAKASGVRLSVVPRGGHEGNGWGSTELSSLFIPRSTVLEATRGDSRGRCAGGCGRAGGAVLGRAATDRRAPGAAVSAFGVAARTCGSRR